MWNNSNPWRQARDMLLSIAIEKFLLHDTDWVYLIPCNDGLWSVYERNGKLGETRFVHPNVANGKSWSVRY